LPVKYFEKLFKSYNWHSLIKTLQRVGLLHRNDRLVRLRESLSKAIRADPEELKRFTQAWIDRLHPLRSHTDTAAFLSLHLLSARRFEDAARVAVDIAQ